MAGPVFVSIDGRAPEAWHGKDAEMLRILNALRPRLRGMKAGVLTLVFGEKGVGAGIEERWGFGVLTRNTGEGYNLEESA